MSQLEKRAEILRKDLELLREKVDNFEIKLKMFMALFKKGE